MPMTLGVRRLAGASAELREGEFALNAAKSSAARLVRKPNRVFLRLFFICLSLMREIASW